MSEKRMEWVAGMDIGGTNTQLGLVSAEGGLVVEMNIPTSQDPDPMLFVRDSVVALKELHGRVGEAGKLVGMGIGAPNGNYFHGTIEFAPNLAWQGKVPLATLFAQELGVPVLLTNDANAAAIGEMMFGAAQGMKDFIEITIGTGLGSGIVCNGELILGHDGFAGEIGHTIAVRDGRKCSCGRAGCLETYVSARGLIWTVEELAPHFPFSSLHDFIQAKSLSARKIHEAANAGDVLAIAAYHHTGTILGQVLADSVAYTSPSAIILFGGVAKASAFLIPPTKAAMENNMLPIFQNKVAIIPSALNDRNAAVLGAAALVWKEQSSKSNEGN